VYLVCPNNEKQSAAERKRGKGRKKSAGDMRTVPAKAVVCHYEKRIGDAPAAEEKQPEPLAV
jgi:hypothetical protein